MEKLDYEIIDPLCRRSIKLLREHLGVEARFCCQGAIDKIDGYHSTKGYISVVLNDKNFDVMSKLAREIAPKIQFGPHHVKLEFNYWKKENPKLILRLPSFLSHCSGEKRREDAWKLIEDTLAKMANRR
jgi:hypothetical protein